MKFTINDIEQSLKDYLNIQSILIVDKSHLHAHHTAMKDHNTCNPTHLKLHIVSADFNEKNSLSRHRMVHKILEPYFKEGLHAINLKLETHNI